MDIADAQRILFARFKKHVELEAVDGHPDSFIIKAKNFTDAMASRGLNNKAVSLPVLTVRQAECRKCPAAKQSEYGDFIVCGECGCPEIHMNRLFDEDPEAYTKLHYPHLVCPRRRPGFNNFFAHVQVINLDKRPARWEAFIKDAQGIEWPFMKPQRYSAVDTHAGTTDQPEWWGKRPAATWGCYQSHLNILRKAMAEKWDSYLVFEDDAIFCDNFAEKVTRFLSHVPDDWEQIYLGGQHLLAPTEVNEHVFRVVDVNRAHAYAVHSRGYAKLYAHLDYTREDVQQDLIKNDRQRHIDFRFAKLTSAEGGLVSYSPKVEWFVGQRAGKSDISSKDLPDRFWNHTIDPNAKPDVKTPPVRTRRARTPRTARPARPRPPRPVRQQRPDVSGDMRHKHEHLRLQWIRPLRRNRDHALFKQFEVWVIDNLQDICANYSSRWIVSILDTFADYGEPDAATLALLGTTLSNGEKIARTAREITRPPAEVTPTRIQNIYEMYDGIHCFMPITREDAHSNWLKRLIPHMQRHRHLGRLIYTILERQLNTPYSTWDILQKTSDRNLRDDILKPLAEALNG